MAKHIFTWFPTHHVLTYIHRYAMIFSFILRKKQKPCQKAFEDRRSPPTDYKAFHSYHHLKENRQPLAERIVREYPIGFDSLL